MQIEWLSPGYLSLPNLSETPWLLPRRERQDQPGTVFSPWKAFSRLCPLRLTRSILQQLSPSSIPNKAGSSHIAPLVLPGSSLPGEQCRIPRRKKEGDEERRGPSAHALPCL